MVIYLQKYLKSLPIFVTQYLEVFGILKYWKKNFPQNLKLAAITPVYMKKDPTLVENYRPVSALPIVSKVFERIIQKQFSSFINDFLSPYFCGYKKDFNTQYALPSLIGKWKKRLYRNNINGLA